MANKNYYKTLGVSKGAGKDEIKKAYKKLARKYHPDISKEADAEAKFKEINEAAEVLLDDEKKQRFDTYGTADGQGFSGGGSGFNPNDFGINLDDIFEQFGFGNSGFGGGFSSRGHSRQNDTSIYSEINISLEEVYFGCEKDISITKEDKCDSCDGRGAKNTSDVETCKTCQGQGVVIEMQRTILGSMRTQKVCSTCRGKGKQIKNPCSSCSGLGSVHKKETISLKVPKGIENGMTLRVSGKGSFDADTSSFGDLYVKVKLKNDKNFEVEGSNLYKEVEINFVQAILGDEVEFEHFGKLLSVKIPQGTQPNTTLRLKGKGLPHFNYNSNGDLYLKVTVEIPKKTSNNQKEILLDYAKTLKDKPLMERLKGIFK